jgi:hypothetical protein
VVATFLGAQVQGDAFRGHYVRMTDPAAQPVFLLDADGRISRAQWEAAIQHRGGDA